MLAWTQRSDGWHSNGFRIELAEPYRWVLVDAGERPVAAGQLREPLAITRSLTECKREAELLAAKRRRHDVQHRQIRTLLIALSSTPFLLGSSSDVNATIVLVALVVAARSLLILLGTLMPRSLREYHEVFYQ